MPDQASRTAPITSLSELADYADYSFLTSLNPDPQATSDGYDHQPRQVCSGHYVPVLPTALKAPGYVAHSQTLFRELGLDDNLAGTVEIGQAHAGLFADSAHRILIETDDCRHPAGAGLACLLH